MLFEATEIAAAANHVARRFGSAASKLTACRRVHFGNSVNTFSPMWRKTIRYWLSSRGCRPRTSCTHSSKPPRIAALVSAPEPSRARRRLIGSHQGAKQAHGNRWKAEADQPFTKLQVRTRHRRRAGLGRTRSRYRRILCQPGFARTARDDAE